MAEPTWKDLVKMLRDLQERINKAEPPAAASLEDQERIRSEQVRISNMLADMESQIQDECFSVDEQSNFVPPFLQ